MSGNKKGKKSAAHHPAVSKNSLRENVVSLFRTHSGDQFNYRQISQLLSIKDAPLKHMITEILYSMKEDGLLEEVRFGKFRLKVESSYITGKVDLTQNGYGFIISPDSVEDVFVSMKNLNHALHGDVVKVLLFARKKRSRPEGEVIEILERGRTTFVGIIDIGKSYAFLTPGAKQIPYDIFIPLKAIGGAKNGEKVVAKITEWPSGAKNPIGEVINVLGLPGLHSTEMHAIIAEFDLPGEFPEEINNVANRLEDIIPPKEYSSRRDFRNIVTFTIDPKDAKDFDDALSLQKLKNGNWEVGVHIADVTYYVKNNDILDAEAFERSTSVYLVDRTIPMLPERLSNFICSLRPYEDKLCYSAVFEMNEEAEVVNQWFGRTVINSNKRFTYEEAEQIILGKEGDFQQEVLTLHKMAQRIREYRFRKGAISFEREEVRFDLDSNGKPLRVYQKEYGSSNQLVEEFMLLANKKVAEFCSGILKTPSPARIGSGSTFVYRIHDKPKLEKLESFAAFITKFGYSIRMSSSKVISESLNELIDLVRGRKEQNLIETLALRSMAKAVYTSKNIGHYGLSFKYYTHFTSPIRRYPDMMVHRLLDYYLYGGKLQGIEELDAQCKHASDMEKRAQDAERASIKYKQVEFMSDKLGQVFDGVISGVAEFGFFVELIENKCEGLVSMRDLGDDYYEFDEKNYCITGSRKKQKYQLGDILKVEVYRFNLEKKQLDFRLAKI